MGQKQKREKMGRKKLSESDKKKQKGIKFSPWFIDFLESRKESSRDLIERACVAYYPELKDYNKGAKS